MPNQHILPGQSLVVQASGVDAQSTPRALSSLTATIDNYDVAYIANIAIDGQLGWINIVPKDVPQGQTITVTVTFTGKSENGTLLPTDAISVDIIGEDVTPQASALSIATGTPSTQRANDSTDPGSATITVI